MAVREFRGKITSIGSTPGDAVLQRLTTRSEAGVMGCYTFIPEVADEDRRTTQAERKYVSSEQQQKLASSPTIPFAYVETGNIPDPHATDFEFFDEGREELLDELREANAYRQTEEFREIAARTRLAREAMSFLRQQQAAALAARSSAN